MRQVFWCTALVSIVVAAWVGVGAVGSGSAAGAPSTVQITAKEFSFTPKAVTVAAGPTRFVVTNSGTMEHDFVIDVLKVKSPLIKPGQTATVLVTLKKGAYQAYCDVPGHKELGMVLSITVK